MTELSLNILDICQNSIKAKANLIEIFVDENIEDDILSMNIFDNGCGMDKQFLDKVEDPFTTTRTTRKVGMGIPLLKMECEMANGSFRIESAKNKGTKIYCNMQFSNIDRLPLGDMNSTILTLIRLNPNIDFVYHHKVNSDEFILDTRELKKVLGDVSLDNNDVLLWIKEYLDENTENLNGGKN